MASSMMHISVANEINKNLHRNKKEFLIGSIAPDLAKIIGQKKYMTHFSTEEESDIPNLDLFRNKYRNHFNNDFVLGYYIHLLTDYLWAKYFISDFLNNGKVYTIDGNKINIDEDTLLKYVYQDYTNLNIELIDKYELDLSIFYEELPEIKPIIEELDLKQLDKLMEKTGLIIESTKVVKPYIFDMELVNKFVDFSVNFILDDLKQNNIH